MQFAVDWITYINTKTLHVQRSSWVPTAWLGCLNLCKCLKEIIFAAQILVHISGTCWTKQSSERILAKVVRRGLVCDPMVWVGRLWHKPITLRLRGRQLGSRGMFLLPVRCWYRISRVPFTNRTSGTYKVRWNIEMSPSTWLWIPMTSTMFSNIPYRWIFLLLDSWDMTVGKSWKIDKNCFHLHIPSQILNCALPQTNSCHLKTDGCKMKYEMSFWDGLVSWAMSVLGSVSQKWEDSLKALLSFWDWFCLCLRAYQFWHDMLGPCKTTQLHDLK